MTTLDNSLADYTASILDSLWDPIGVADMPEANGEYGSYVPAVVGALQRGAKVEEVAALLDSLVINTSGLGGPMAQSTMVAMLLVGWRDGNGAQQGAPIALP